MITRPPLLLQLFDAPENRRQNVPGLPLKKELFNSLPSKGLARERTRHETSRLAFVLTLERPLNAGPMPVPQPRLQASTGRLQAPDGDLPSVQASSATRAASRFQFSAGGPGGLLLTKRQKLGEEAIGHAHEIKIYALRKLGEMLKKTEKNKGAASGGKKIKSRGIYLELRDKTLTLADLDLDKKTSFLSQCLASIPERQIGEIARRERSVTQVLREKKAAEIRRQVSLPDARYRVIYADPPGPDSLEEEKT